MSYLPPKILVESVKITNLIHEGGNYQTVVEYAQMEGTNHQYRSVVTVTDIYSIVLVQTLLAALETAQNRTAELEDAATSAKERYEADLQSLRDELSQSNRRLDAVLIAAEDGTLMVSSAILSATELPTTAEISDQEILDTLAAAGPQQDSGSALVGVECYVWGNPEHPEIGVQGPCKIDKFCPEPGAPGYYEVWDKSITGCCFDHARPVALGLPS